MSGISSEEEKTLPLIGGTAGRRRIWEIIRSPEVVSACGDSPGWSISTTFEKDS
jgi:hypothetical protein